MKWAFFLEGHKPGNGSGIDRRWASPCVRFNENRKTFSSVFPFFLEI
jgi:hypothetical protein